jgi:hypothetical protein
VTGFACDCPGVCKVHFVHIRLALRQDIVRVPHAEYTLGRGGPDRIGPVDTTIMSALRCAVLCIWLGAVDSNLSSTTLRARPDWAND